jgi:hypothetical protein
MRKSGVVLFLTFVFSLDFAAAAKSTPSPDFDDHEYQEEMATDPTEDQSRRETIDIAEPPPASPGSPRPKGGFFYRYRHALTLNAGMFDTAISHDEIPRFLPFLGLKYRHLNQNRRMYEAGIDIFPTNSAAASFSWFFSRSRTRFRPHFRIGGGLDIVPVEQLTSVLRLSNYHLRSAVGFEHMFWNGKSLRFEMESIATLNYLHAAANVGYVWAW